eukprot:scaffold296990_cov24-Tisochrysis_lutea.AAC.1
MRHACALACSQSGVAFVCLGFGGSQSASKGSSGEVEAGARPLAPPASSHACLAGHGVRPKSPVGLATRDRGGVSSRAGPAAQRGRG